MAVPKRFNVFSKMDELSRRALLRQGRAGDHGFAVVREGDLLQAKQRGMDLRPEFDQFGYPLDPRFANKSHPSYSANKPYPDDLDMDRPTPHNPFKPRPPGF